MTTTQRDNANIYEEDDDDENDDEFGLEEMGFLFEGSRESTLKHLQWVVPTSGHDDDDDDDDTNQTMVRVALQVVDDTPGAVISGHYLWPAAPALAQHLVQHYSTAAQQRKHQQDNSNDDNQDNFSILPVQTVLELGAGCALASLVALQVFVESLQCVVITDHDPGTLKRARDNYDLTMEQQLQIEEVTRVASIPVLYEILSWGDVEACQTLLAKVQQELLSQPTGDQSDNSNNNHNSNHNSAFDLLLGSDLIYCRDVIRPLFETASTLLLPGGTFWLSQSFPFDDESEQEIDAMCERFGWTRTIVTDTLQEAGREDSVRIQKFLKQYDDSSST